MARRPTRGAPGEDARPLDFKYPGGVAIDPASHRVYFSDNADDTITYVNADGSGRTVVYRSTDALANPRCIAIKP